MTRLGVDQLKNRITYLLNCFSWVFCDVDGHTFEVSHLVSHVIIFLFLAPVGLRQLIIIILAIHIQSLVSEFLVVLDFFIEVGV